ncbi:hypothetical protein AB4201_15715, partial [Vibrio lentus]
MSDKYPFPSSKSMYWSHTDTSYDQAVSMFDSLSDLQKKMMNSPVLAPKTLEMREQKQAQKDALEKSKQETPSSPAESVPNNPATPSSDSTESEVSLENVFMLGWCQVEETGQLDLMWDELFTPETSQKTINFIKGQNRHLNSYVRQGEIVVLPTMRPVEEKDKQALKDLKEEAQAASTELAKLKNEEVATLHRHFDLFSYQLEKRIREDGLPSDYYAQVSTGVGATAMIVEQNLTNIQNVVLEINDLYGKRSI